MNRERERAEGIAAMRGLLSLLTLVSVVSGVALALHLCL